MPDPATQRAIEAVWRIESARLIATLTRQTRDVGLAEELVQDAFVAALQQWPAEGIPQRPGAWLLATARRRGIDRARRDRKLRDLEADLLRDGGDPRAVPAATEQLDERLDRGFDDDVLRLLFLTCHPALPPDARVALTLRLVGGLTTGEIARAFLAPEPTIAQRIVRSKRTLTGQQVPFEVPSGGELGERLGSVLAVIYLVFNEGYAATAGEDWMRPALCQEGMRLGRILAAAMPHEPEVHGLVALMELQASRLGARTDADGRPILLLDQDRGRWDHLLIRRGLAALASAERRAPRGPYTLQAAIAACHARARTPAGTDWPRIAALYAELAVCAPSPVIELNRAIAVGMAEGPAAGLALLDALAEEPQLRCYHLYYGARADLLHKLGRFAAARADFLRAAALAQNARERDLLQQRAAESGRLVSDSNPPEFSDLPRPTG